MDYKEKLKLAKEALESGSYDRETIEYIFPELKESEDEQHRKWILEYLYDGLRKSDKQFKEQFKSAIAWLEKQDKKDSQVIHPKFTSDDFLAIESCMQTVSKEEELYKQLKSLYGKITDVYWGVKQVE